MAERTVGAAGAPMGDAAEIVPIIVIPGVAGTRLRDSDGRAWNPYGYPLPSLTSVQSRGMHASNVERLKRVEARLEPDDKGPFSLIVAAYRSKIKNLGVLVAECYGALAIRLHVDLTDKLKPRGQIPRVYCFGYDWRQTNVDSATRLSALVDEAQKDAGGKKVILVAHSMGGLVARYYCKLLGGADKVRALFLVASPTLGALMAYQGIKFGELDFELGVLLGQGEDAMDLMRRITAIYQLLPTRGYAKEQSASWLRFERKYTGYAPINADNPEPSQQFGDCTDTSKLYNDMYTGFQDRADTNAICAFNTMYADAFHRALGDSGTAYMPDPTYLVYSGSQETAIGYELTYPKIEVVNARNQLTVWRTTERDLDLPHDYGENNHGQAVKKVAGDKTVPEASATSPTTSVPFKDRRAFVKDHVGITGYTPCIDYLIDKIAEIVLPEGSW